MTWPRLHLACLRAAYRATHLVESPVVAIAERGAGERGKIFEDILSTVVFVPLVSLKVWIFVPDFDLAARSFIALFATKGPQRSHQLAFLIAKNGSGAFWP